MIEEEHRSLPERLREGERNILWIQGYEEDGPLLLEAADRIESLEAEVLRLKGSAARAGDHRLMLIAAALTSLAQEGRTTDLQDGLITGVESRGMKPGAIGRMVDAVIESHERFRP